MLRELKETILLVSSCEFWRMGILWTISLFESYFQLLIGRFCGSKSTPSACSMDSQSGLSSKPVCVITGPTSGLGKATACALAKKGFHVILVGRSSQALSETMKEIRSQNEDAKLTAFEVDMTSYQSMLQFQVSLEQYFSESGLPNSIQLLVNNAGIMPVSSRPTIEGYDRTIATNYIGPFTLTSLLLIPLANVLCLQESSMLHRSHIVMLPFTSLTRIL